MPGIKGITRLSGPVPERAIWSCDDSVPAPGQRRKAGALSGCDGNRSCTRIVQPR
jgi:hypothetical protein